MRGNVLSTTQSYLSSEILKAGCPTHWAIYSLISIQSLLHALLVVYIDKLSRTQCLDNKMIDLVVNINLASLNQFKCDRFTSADLNNKRQTM